MDNLRILLTGVTGQVGFELAHVLRNLGTVIPTIAPGEKYLGKATVMDLADPDSICKVVDEIKPNLIVNPAAYTAVDKAEEQKDLAMKINGEAPRILAEKAKEYRAGLIHFSTDYVYTGEGNQPYSEESATGPLNHYGYSKLVGDQAVAEADIPYLIFRTSWVYGVYGNNFVKTMLRLGQERETLNVIDDQVGAPTSARTLADITGLVLASFNRDTLGGMKIKSGIYHAVNSGQTSWWGFAQKIFELARKLEYKLKIKEVLPITTKEYPTPAIRPKNSRLSTMKLQDYFGINPLSWDKAIELVIPLL